MQQIVEVRRLLSENRAEVSLQRASACSGDCHTCGGCGAVKETLLVSALNPIGARPGDRVIVETATKSILFSAVLVYFVPLLLFLLGYFLGTALGRLPGLFGAAGFCLGFLPVFFRNRYLSKRTEFRITGYAGD